MALLRKCLIEVRTRGLPAELFPAALAVGTDTVFPPLDERRFQRAVPGVRDPAHAERAATTAPRPHAPSN